MTKHFFVLPLSLLLLSCGSNPEKTEVEEAVSSGEVMIYTHRHYDVDKQLFDQFTAKTGIKVNVVSADADELMMRLENEGPDSPADLLVTVDAGRLVRAKEENLLLSIQSDVLNANVPANLRDSEGYWFGQTIRARVIVYDKTKVDATQLSTYEALADGKWKGKILVRSSGNIYNQSLVASMVVNNGEEATEKWAKSLVVNFAREPMGNDRDQVKAIAAGLGSIALVNTYYIGKLLESEDAEEVKAGQSVGIFFPNQQDRGTHINVSGAGVTKYAPNRENAIKLLEFLSEPEAQRLFAEANHEYPVHPQVEASQLLKSWGAFKQDPLALSKLGEFNSQAVELMDVAGWK